MVIAKESSAAHRADEFAGYLHLLTTNGSDLTDLMRSALGGTAAARFDTIWSAQNDYLVHYTIGLVAHDKSKSDAATASLVNGFVPQFSQFAADTAQIPLGPIAQLVMQHALQTKAVIDDQVAQRYPRMYARPSHRIRAGCSDRGCSRAQDRQGVPRQVSRQRIQQGS